MQAKCKRLLKHAAFSYGCKAKEYVKSERQRQRGEAHLLLPGELLVSFELLALAQLAPLSLLPLLESLQQRDRDEWRGSASVNVQHSEKPSRERERVQIA